jgi:hypothetical protein
MNHRWIVLLLGFPVTFIGLIFLHSSSLLGMIGLLLV